MSKILSGEQYASVQAWNQPEIEHEALAGAEVVADAAVALVEPSVEIVPEVQIDEVEIERIKQAAYQEGLELGKREGIAAGQKFMTEQAAKLGELLAALEQGFHDSDPALENELLFLTLAVAKQVLRRELKTDPGQIVAVIREALGELPSGAAFTRLSMHPEDAAFVRKALSLENQKTSLEIREDPAFSRGGCKIETDTSQIDASIETRIAEIAATVLGGERRDDRSE